jgi:DNA-binding CsgD family transcriptional regulator
MKAAKLTPQQLVIVKLLCEGKTSREMAEKLKLSPRTIEVHRRSIRLRLRLRSVPEIMRWAVKERLISM